MDGRIKVLFLRLMKTTLFILFNLIIFSLLAGKSDVYADSLSKITDKEKVAKVLSGFKDGRSQELYSLGLATIKQSKLDLNYELSLFHVYKAFGFYDINRDSVYFYLNKVDLAIEPKGSIELRQNYNRAVGLCEMFDSNYDIAITSFHKNIAIAKGAKNDDALQMSYADAALPHYYSGNFLEAIDYWRLSMGMSEKMKDFNTAYGTSLNIALAFAQIDEVDSAKLYKEKCIALGEEEGVSLLKSTLYLNTGVIEYQNKDFEEAIKMFKKSTQFCLKEGEQKVYAKAISNISSCYLELGQPEKSKEFLLEALDIVKEAKSLDLSCLYTCF